MVDFAKQLPGFLRLPEEDRVTLLKSSVFEVLLVWLAATFDAEVSTAAAAGCTRDTGGIRGTEGHTGHTGHTTDT